MPSEAALRVLVIDDSAFNRKTVAEFLESVPGIVVVGKASDGEEGLRLALLEKPDVITLDLEMPRMDGFTFLRLLMAKQPTPVIVISSHTEQETIFRALDLGALDFVAKPTHRISPEIRGIRDEVIQKVLLTRLLRRNASPQNPVSENDATVPPSWVASEALPRTSKLSQRASITGRTLATKVVAIGASTGGPNAIAQVLVRLPQDLETAIAIVQHMPPKFTTTFADRLNRQSALQVLEVQGVERLLNGVVYLAPGDACLEIGRIDEGLCAVTMAPTGKERYVPSADRLFHSVAASLGLGQKALCVVLTGMGDDGAQGAKAMGDKGFDVVAEDESTAVIPGMPRAAVATGVVTQVARLEHIAGIIIEFAKR